MSLIVTTLNRDGAVGWVHKRVYPLFVRFPLERRLIINGIKLPLPNNVRYGCCLALVRCSVGAAPGRANLGVGVVERFPGHGYM